MTFVIAPRSFGYAQKLAVATPAPADMLKSLQPLVLICNQHFLVKDL
jgi:hypothetical protein